MNTDPRDIPRLVSLLRESMPPRNRVLSAYVDTTPQRVAHRAHVLFLRDACKALRALLDPTERELFESARENVERFLSGNFVPAHPGLAVFAAPAPGYLHTAGLPVRPREDVVWDTAPALAELQEIIDRSERIAVALFDKQRTRLFTIFLGDVEERREFDDDVPTRQQGGGWQLPSQTRLQRHHEDRVMRHAKEAAAALMDLLRTRPFDHLLLAGSDEAVARLRHHLPGPLHARLAGTARLPVEAGEADVLRVARDLVERLSRADDVRAVQALVDAATTRHAALGLHATLAAVNEGRVHELLVADAFSAVGGECRRCNRLVPGVDRCDLCGGTIAHVGDVRERLERRAVAEGARVEHVSGEAARLLAVHDGLGAWTRYGLVRGGRGARAVA